MRPALVQTTALRILLGPLSQRPRVNAMSLTIARRLSLSLKSQRVQAPEIVLPTTLIPAIFAHHHLHLPPTYHEEPPASPLPFPKI